MIILKAREPARDYDGDRRQQGEPMAPSNRQPLGRPIQLLYPRQPERDIKYFAFCDMSGGSADDACLAIAHAEGDICVLDWVAKQNGPAPFNPRNAVAKFCDILHDWNISSVTGDSYAGSTFRHDFYDRGVKYISSHLDKTEIYETFEPRLNAGEVRLYDDPTLTQQLLTLVVRGAKVGHEPGGHDDYANACCG